MKPVGVISGGPYSGQKYWTVRRSSFPRWFVVCLTDENGRKAYREVREQFLESE